MKKNKTQLQLNGDSILQRDTGQEFTYIDGEVVMLSIENGEYYGLDSVGSRIWELLEKEIQFEKLIDVLTEEYDVSREQCQKETLEYLEELFNKNLLLKKNS